jgi:2-dehydro-3-deoxyphosphogluconate aldolase / (4S)-4-hydroxy-2-oxoglutarate aldolase
MRKGSGLGGMQRVSRASDEASRVVAGLASVRVVPVLVIDDEAIAPPVTVALRQAGMSHVEITLRTEAGLAAIAAAKD